MEEPRPFTLVENSCGMPESDVATTIALENPAFQTICWITSMHEGGGSVDRDGTSGHGAELEGSTAMKFEGLLHEQR